MLERIIEGLADAGNRVKRSSQCALLGLALTFAPAYAGCGDDSTPPQGDDGSQDGVCGNSPLAGKYLLGIGDCEMGMMEPFNQDCSGVILEARGPNGAEEYLEYPFTYQGSWVTVDSEYGHISWQIYTQVQLSDFSSPNSCEYADQYDEQYPGARTLKSWNADLPYFFCLSSRLREEDPRFIAYPFFFEGYLCPGKDNIGYLADVPWPGREACRNSQQYHLIGQAISECREEYPYADEM